MRLNLLMNSKQQLPNPFCWPSLKPLGISKMKLLQLYQRPHVKVQNTVLSKFSRKPMASVHMKAFSTQVLMDHTRLLKSKIEISRLKSAACEYSIIVRRHGQKALTSILHRKTVLTFSLFLRT